MVLGENVIKDKWDFFDEIAAWKEDERFSSRPPDLKNKHCIQLLKIGPMKSVPWLMENLSSKPSWQCLLLLEVVSNADPVQPHHAGKFYHQVVDRMDWWEQKGRKEYNMTGKTWGDT